MPNLLVVGAQWGDEGKGRVVDHLARDASHAIRFGGGANAGHTLVVDGRRVVLHLIPAGALQPGCRGLIGQGCVADPLALCGELDGLAAAGIPHQPDRIGVSPLTFVVTPFHRALDRATGAAIGTTGRGIGPSYADKVARRGLRLGELVDGAAADILATQRAQVAALRPELELPSVEEALASLQPAARRLAPYLADVTSEIEAAMRRDEVLLFEGAQGAGLDLDFGSYPFVTSSHTGAGGVCNGVGLWVDLHRRVGVLKAYATRVGHGPFPTEDHGAAGDHIRAVGREVGATTGRPRRCGWLDLPALKAAVRWSGLTDLVVTKLDVLAGLDEIPVAVEHGPNGPRYQYFAGFGDITGARTWAELPAAAQALLTFIEASLSTPIALVTVGAERGAQIPLRPLP